MEKEKISYSSLQYVICLALQQCILLHLAIIYKM
jgi:hypothetical protein